MQPFERNEPVVEDLNEPPILQVRRGFRFKHQSQSGTRQRQRRCEVRIVEDELAADAGTDFSAVTDFARSLTIFCDFVRWTVAALANDARRGSSVVASACSVYASTFSAIASASRICPATEAVRLPRARPSGMVLVDSAR